MESRSSILPYSWWVDRLDTAAREARANSFGQTHNRRGSSRDQPGLYSNVSPFVDSWSDCWIRISPEGERPPKNSTPNFLCTQGRCGSQGGGLLGSVGGLALNWQRSETYLWYTGGTHPPSESRQCERRILKSGIPGSKQEVDGRLRRQTRALAYPRLGFV